MSVRKFASLIAGAALALVTVPAHATVFSFAGTITSFSDPDNILNAGVVVGSQFLGTITYDDSDIGVSFPPGPDRISRIDIAGGLSVDTPNDGAFINRAGPDRLFSGILPFNPVVFASGTSSRACAGSGGVTLLDNGQMQFSLGCVFSPNLRIVGEGRFSSTAAAVPEPVTWAMMLVGFGMISATARYRRRSAATTYA